ncbi:MULTISPECIES: methyltransferase domain-containing protein [unclassified Paraburkholderia]|uniref:methyltransferase domain-containing protein n=1 Tax=unclassified Paraburkholderia TaxID=2615204 RepID=UPI002AB06E27|nr:MULTISPECIES: methyltransferase domain-containing protein [unclassified Paraburkholderia]
MQVVKFPPTQLEDKVISNPSNIGESYAEMRYSSAHNILRSESIYGDGFQSPGGLSGFISELGDKIKIESGNKIIDVGSGLGGAAFYFANEFDVEIVGLDTSPIMTDIAISRQKVRDPFQRVTFLNTDIHSADIKEKSVDIIYSRDTLMYEKNKQSFFERCFSILRPGGLIYITDFCKNDKSKDFDNFESSSGYDLKTIAEYSEIISNSGFDCLASDDISQSTIEKLSSDLREYKNKTQKNSDLIKKQDADHIVGRWVEKINLLKSRCLAQGFFIGVKS